jgi:hypothetical protein
VAETAAIVAHLYRPFVPLRARVANVWARLGPAELAIGIGCALVGIAGTIGADSRWLAALGSEIVKHGSIPHGVPFASAPSGDWPNVPVLAELIFHGLNAALGERGLLLAQFAAVACSLAILAVDMRRGAAEDLGICVAIALVVAGAFPALLVVRAQLFSLVLFPALAALLRADMRSPSRRLWLVPLLLALWSNLHGAVLVGLAVAAVYLALARARSGPLEAAAMLGASALAVCATPAVERTPAYYLGVLRNEAARRGEGLWAPLSLNSGVDLLLLATGIVLLACALWARPAMWEVVALTALALLAVKTSRSGVWLLFFAGPPAARAVRLQSRTRVWALPTVAALIVAVYGLARGPISPRASDALVRQTLVAARGTPVLAQDALAEQVALAGGRVWMGNPLDAFPRRDQDLYLDWLDARPGGSGAFAHAPRAVLVKRYGSANQLTAATHGLRVAAADSYAILYVKRQAGGSARVSQAARSTRRFAARRGPPYPEGSKPQSVREHLDPPALPRNAP